MHVLLIAQGTYPFHFGGVSTWCQHIIGDLPEVDFTLMSLVSDPHKKPLFELPPNVIEFRPVPLWGVREVLETRRGLTVNDIRQRYRRATETAVAGDFVPTFGAFLGEIFTEDSEPDRLGRLVHQMHRFLQEYDFDLTLRSKAVWTCFVETAQKCFPRLAADHGYPHAGFSLLDLTHGMKWLYHVFFPLAEPIPRVDVAHAAMAGVCTMVAVVAKLEHGAGFLLTEHGVYLRECYLAESSSSSSIFLKLLRLRFARRMAELSYALADQISPVCNYNQRWELKLGAHPDRLKTIYLGANSTAFAPSSRPSAETPPVVVWVGRISPVKDLDTLLRAASLVREARPDVEFRLYGSAAPEDAGYFKELTNTRKKLGLENTVIFGGYMADPSVAYNQGDVVVLSSITEGFPFTILEAMFCAKPVVATDVGGVSEQIGSCGIVVEPRNPEAMAEAILALINDRSFCAVLGEAAREKAVEEFSIRRSKEAYYASYVRLSNHRAGSLASSVDSDTAGMRRQAVEGMRPYVPVNSDPGRTLFGRDEPAGSGIALAGSLPSMDLSLRLWPVEQAKSPNPVPAERAKAKLNVYDVFGLARKARQANQQPVDFLEITAYLESLGITDDVAAQRYGASDTFGLAEAVLKWVRVLIAKRI